MSAKNGNRFYLNVESVMSGRGEIFQTPRSKIWQFRSWVTDERKYYGKTLKTTDKSIALQLAEEEVLQLNSSQQLGHSVFGITIRQLCNDWLNEQEDRMKWELIKPSRYASLRQRLGNHIYPYLSEQGEKVNHLTRQSMMSYPSWRRSKVNGEVKDITIQHECSIINNTCKYAFNKSHLQFEKMQLPKNDIKVEEPDRDYFTRDEWKSFYRCFPSFINDGHRDIDKYYRQLIRDFSLVAEHSCSRVGELRQVRWNMIKVVWVDKRMKDGSIQKRDTIEWNIPKNITKTNTNRKFVSRGGKFIERIRRYYPRPITDDGFVFSSYTDDGVIPYKTLMNNWIKLVDYSNVEKEAGKHFVLYSLRHYGITNRIAHGVSPYLVAKMSGTSLHFIESNYEHLQMDIMRNAALQEATLDSNDYSVDDE